MQTIIIENEMNRLIEKLRDFGVDPATYLAAKVYQLDVERLERGATAKPEETKIENQTGTSTCCSV